MNDSTKPIENNLNIMCMKTPSHSGMYDLD